MRMQATGGYERCQVYLTVISEALQLLHANGPAAATPCCACCSLPSAPVTQRCAWGPAPASRTKPLRGHTALEGKLQSLTRGWPASACSGHSDVAKHTAARLPQQDLPAQLAPQL